jgi:hypothetical protein
VCSGQNGFFRGNGVACASVTCNVFLTEVEPNETKATATALNLVNQNEVISGSTTGSSTAAGATSLDTFRLKTPTGAAGIYRHRLALQSATAGQVGTLRGLNQTGATAGFWPGPVGTVGSTDTVIQTSSATASPASTNQWYGFGKQEELYYRVTGSTSSTAPYRAVWTTDPITPTVIPGSFQAGAIDIASAYQGNTTDLDFWIYDSNFNAIDGFGNDGASTFGGSATGVSAAALLRREYAAGTYYLAMSNFNLSNNKPSPCDDNFRTGALMDFPDVAVNSSTTTGVNVSFGITDANGARGFAATRPGAFDIAWYRFDVTGTIGTGACCKPDGTCTDAVSRLTCLGQKGVWSDGTACASANCAPQSPVFAVDLRTAGRRWISFPSNYPALNVLSAAPTFSGFAMDFDAPATTLYGIISPTTPPAQFGTIDQATGNFTQVALVSGAGAAEANWGDLCADPANGLMYALAGNNLYTIDTASGATTLVAVLTGGPAGALYIDLGIDASGNMFAHDIVGDQLCSVNKTTGAVTVIGPTGINANFAQGMDFDWATNTLYATMYIGTGVNVYAALDTATGGVKSYTDLTNWNAEMEMAVKSPPPVTCYANCDGSTQAPVLNVADFTCFLSKYAAGAAYANCDGSTQAPVHNVADFTCFLTKYAAGCP